MSRAVWKGTVIADSDDTTVVDGYTYFPRTAINWDLLRGSDHQSVCGWKGTASYYDVVVDGQHNRNAAWWYPTPSDQAAPMVRDRVGFWRGVRIERDDAERPRLRQRMTGLLGGAAAGAAQSDARPGAGLTRGRGWHAPAGAPAHGRRGGGRAQPVPRPHPDRAVPPLLRLNAVPCLPRAVV